jgi:catechol 2,3-dioxygenase-like lactoylglutathione lyase family enzyme
MPRKSIPVKTGYFLFPGKVLFDRRVWICIMQGEPPSPRTYNHVAFYVPDDELNGYIEKIKLSGAEIRTGRPRVSGEGRSVYFYDFDNNLFELHTGTLRERLDRYAALQDS